MAKYQSMAFQLLGLVCLSLIPKSFATDFTIGNSAGWSVSNAQSYNQWAEKNRFQIGDSIVFNYPSGQDSVLLVSQDDYNNCNTYHPIQKFDDGHTVFKFNQSGSHYFISGNKDNCLKNEKVVVIVLADRNNRSSNTNPSPPPSPAPEAQQSPSPPTPSEINPTPAPASDQTPPPPNAAASSFAHITFLGYLGAFAASSLALA
ncbi:early nodulin-like protein 9 [Humulus lupulus]|uniref:early nodulin-like protein 9 n=1 Tax=Humulus lupulus TaxID=3486 RepID=UPI002B409B97|nr:early nodulin-like protein 9 [Humulus lupulus]